MRRLGPAFLLGLVALTTPTSASELPIVGTGDGIEMLQALAEAFNAENKGVTVQVPPSIGSGGAIASVGSDKDVLGRVARPLTDKDQSQGLKAVPIVRIPSAIFVHPSARVTSLTAAQVADIFSGKIANWSEVGGADLRVRVVRRENGDSTLQVLRASMPGWKDLAFTEKSKLAMTTQEAVQSVKDVEGAIGFGPHSTALKDGTVVLRIDGNLPGDPNYPSAVTLALIHKDTTITPDAKVFLSFVQTAKAKAVLKDMGGVPIE
jgi:phosphate transport system substrate-binding protein